MYGTVWLECGATRVYIHTCSTGAHAPPPPFVKKKKEPKAYFMGTPTDGTCRDGKRAAVPNVRQGPAHGGRTSPAPLAYLAHLNNDY